MSRKFILTCIQLLLAAVFIFSALTKISTFNDFVYFVYGILDWPLKLVDILSFLLIALEFVIGIQFLLFSAGKKLIYGTLFFVLSLSLFVVIFPAEDCHCFGNYFKFNSTQTLLKNVGILLFLFLMLWLNKSSVNYKWKTKVIAIVSVLSFITLAIIQPPQILYNLVYGTDTLLSRKQESSEETLRALDKYNMHDQKSIAIMASPKCKYCITEMKKINKLLEKYQLAANTTCLIFGKEKDSVEFNNKVNTKKLASNIIDLRDFALLTKGNLPSLLFINKEEIYYFRGAEVNEDVMKDFMTLD